MGGMLKAAVFLILLLFPVFVLIAFARPQATEVQQTVAHDSLPWPPSRNPEVDLSFLLEKPAGARGFVTIRNGHLATIDGSRFRIWGVNLTAGATVPPKDEAPEYARLLAQRGFNCVRFHFLDLPAPLGIIASGGDDTRRLDVETLDRLDFFICELKKNGIYSNLNLNVGRR